ncbi:MAG: carbamoylphosphate synthase large subunit [Bacilli bacterium]|nr:carbamoylphosphate synthase large subunit [Bacilli bacterium]
MNFVFISPNYPQRYFKWIEALAARGITVLGIGDEWYTALHPRLSNALTEYRYCQDMNNRGEMIRILSELADKYGKLDYIESNNEWWLNLDAELREHFHVATGFYPEDMEHIKAKSAMKEYFAKGGAKTMRYMLVSGKEDKEKAIAFRKEVGYPLFVKPNVGVGAADSYALHNDEEFDAFFEKRLPETYIMEEYISGHIVSFDGICNSKGDVVFCTSDHFPVPIDKIVNGFQDVGYYTNPFDLPMNDIDAKKFEKVGRQVVKAFGIKKRFFHIEFFVLDEDKPGLAKKGEFVALECNMRSPGGNTPDLIDYANSVSVYEIYADVIAYDENRQKMDHPKFYAWSAARRDEIPYKHSDAEIRERYKNNICMTGRYPKSIAGAMGDNYYFAKFKTLDEAIEFDRFTRERA